ncbi:Tyrosine-protein kinase Btk29A, partial [Eumeta japonica]
ALEVRPLRFHNAVLVQIIPPQPVNLVCTIIVLAAWEVQRPPPLHPRWYTNSGTPNSKLKNAEYEVIDDSQEHWWKVKDMGNVGYIPSNYVKPKLYWA